MTTLIQPSDSSNSIPPIPKRLSQWIQAVNPLSGINWVELRKAYGVFIDNPSQGILHILAAERQSNWQKWVKARLACQAVHLREVPLTINISELLLLPASTLGGAYARHITSQGFDPDAFATPDNQEDWVDQRAALSHDIYHVITGFDGSPTGEFGLATFALLQYRDLLNVFVLSHLPWFAIGNIHLVPKTFAGVIKGFRMGQQSKPIFAYPFESKWTKSVNEVRQELGIIKN